MQFQSNACESIKIGSLKARPSDCRLRPCMTARPRQACRAFSTSPSQPSSPLSLSLTYLSMPLLQKKQAGSGSLGAGSESVWRHGGACRGRGLAQAVGGWAGEQNQSQLSRRRKEEPPAASGGDPSADSADSPARHQPPPTVDTTHLTGPTQFHTYILSQSYQFIEGGTIVTVCSRDSPIDEPPAT